MSKVARHLILFYEFISYLPSEVVAERGVVVDVQGAHLGSQECLKGLPIVPAPQSGHTTRRA